MTSKERAKLKSIASNIDTILQVGKGGINEQLIKQVEDALTARELIKLRVLETAPQAEKETAQLLAQATSSDVVQVIGTKIILYRNNPKKNIIKL